MTMGLDVDELDDLDAFMTEVGAAFRSQRTDQPTGDARHVRHLARRPHGRRIQATMG